MRQIDSNVVVYKWSVTKRTRRNNEWESIYRYVDVGEKQPKLNLLLNHNFFSCWNAVQFSLGSFLFDSIWFIALFRRLQFTSQTHAAHKLSLRTNKNVRLFSSTFSFDLHAKRLFLVRPHVHRYVLLHIMQWPILTLFSLALIGNCIQNNWIFFHVMIHSNVSSIFSVLFAV